MNGSAATNWRPIGTVLVESGAITQEDLDAALAEQRLSGKRLGEILIDSGRITWLQLAHGIAEQAKDLETTSAAAVAHEPELEFDPEPEQEPEDEALAAPAPVLMGPPVSELPRPVPVDAVDEATARLQTVETMLKERQRAFLELVSVTERLRATVAKLQDELLARDAEITRLRSQSAPV